MGIAICERLWFGLRFRVKPGMTGVIMIYKFVFFTLLSSTFPLIRGKRSELATHKIVKIAVDCWLFACRLSACFAPAGAKYE